MFEAVGEKWWPTYFGTRARRRCAPGGRACIQTITIADERFERYRTQSDFIQQYIFPGGMLASPSRFRRRGGARRARGRSVAPTSAPTTPRRCSRWLAAFDREAATPCARRASTSASSAAGASTSPTAPPASTAARPMSRSTRWLPSSIETAPAVALRSLRRHRRRLRARRRGDAGQRWRRLHAAAAARRRRRRWRPRLQPQGGGVLKFLGLSIYDGWYWSDGRGWSLDAAIRARPPLPPQPRRREDRRAQRRGDRAASASARRRSGSAGARRCSAIFPDVPRATASPASHLPPGDRPLLPQRHADRRHRRPRVRARLLRHLARPAVPRAATSAASCSASSRERRRTTADAARRRCGAPPPTRQLSPRGPGSAAAPPRTGCSRCRWRWPRCRCTCTCPSSTAARSASTSPSLGVLLLVLRLARRPRSTRCSACGATALPLAARG